jgi:predicted amidohydrolase
MLYDKAPGNGVNVSIAQTNLPPQLLHGSAEQGRLEIIIAQHRLLERRLQRRADGDASIAVWPESAMPGLRVVVPNDTRVSKTGFHSVLHTYGMSAASELVSEVQVVDARGHTASRAYKVRPVPIAEKALRGGDKAILHRSLGIPFGALVCYESAFPDLARHLVARGARWLAVLTNDAFEWPSFLSHLNHALARLRAIENGVVVARAANGGVSVIFSPTGGVRAEVAPFNVGIATSTIESLDSTTFYTRHGGLIETLVLAIAATLVTAAMVPASAGGVQQKGNEGHPHPRWYPAVAVVLMMAAVSSANYWQFNMMVGAHELHETPSFSARHSNNSPYTDSLAAALNQVHRRYGFLTTRQPHPQSQADLARWAAAHGLETRTGTLDDTHPALRYAMTGLLRLASGDLAVITARRDDDFRLYLPHGSEYRWVPLQRLVRMQRGPVLWFLPKAQKNPLLAVRLD